MYLIETQPLTPPDETAFALPTTRPLPEAFPAPFLIDEAKVVTELAWDSLPGGSAYQLTLLTEESSFDVADSFRELLDSEGWDLTDDQAIGFATVLQFASDDGRVQGTARMDAFAEDDDYTEIVLQLQATTGSADE